MKNELILKEKKCHTLKSKDEKQLLDDKEESNTENQQPIDLEKDIDGCPKVQVKETTLL